MKKEENRMQVQILLEKVEKMEGSVNIGIRKKKTVYAFNKA